jgi:predicted MFS family arabinose efflux permease
MFKTLVPLGFVLIFRFFGLFVVLPVLSYYSLELEGSTPILVGLLMSGYALTQMIFQAPFGRLSDIIGRKKTLVFGLIIFTIGSIVCYISEDIYTLLAGRLLQGAGAVGAVIMAMAGDLVKEEDRAKAMAILGGSIALSFSLAMIIGPIVSASFGIKILFLITAIISILAIFIIVFKVPNPPKIKHIYNNKPKIFHILFEHNLFTMNVTNFLQKAIMTFTFVIIPIYMINEFSWDKSDLFKVYIPGIILGIFAMGPAAIFAEKKLKAKEVLIVGIIFFILSFYFMSLNDELFFIIGIFLFFIGFNVHEPIMQSLVSKFAKIHEKGISLGISNAFGYFGTFIGGILGASAINNFLLSEVVLFVSIIGGMWIVSIFLIKNPGRNKNLYLDMNTLKSNYQFAMKKEGIIEWYINESENTLVIKYNEDIILVDDIKSDLI